MTGSTSPQVEHTIEYEIDAAASRFTVRAFAGKVRPELASRAVPPRAMGMASCENQIIAVNGQGEIDQEASLAKDSVLLHG